MPTPKAFELPCPACAAVAGEPCQADPPHALAHVARSEALWMRMRLQLEEMEVFAVATAEKLLEDMTARAIAAEARAEAAEARLRTVEGVTKSSIIAQANAAAARHRLEKERLEAKLEESLRRR